MKPKSVFVDTGAWVALRYEPDERHERTRAMACRLRDERVSLVTSEWVLAESVTLLKARGAVDHALALGETIRSGAFGAFVEASVARGRRAWELFRRYRDLRAGYVDCTSFAVMEELRLTTYFGFDRDFQAAGFVPYR